MQLRKDSKANSQMVTCMAAAMTKSGLIKMIAIPYSDRETRASSLEARRINRAETLGKLVLTNRSSNIKLLIRMISNSITLHRTREEHQMRTWAFWNQMALVMATSRSPSLQESYAGELMAHKLIREYCLSTFWTSWRQLKIESWLVNWARQCLMSISRTKRRWTRSKTHKISSKSSGTSWAESPLWEMAKAEMSSSKAYLKSFSRSLSK